MQQIEELEGVLTEELEQELIINEKELESKIKAYCHIISLKKGEIKVIDDEIDRLSALKKVKETTIERLKSNVLSAVEMFGYTGKSGNKKLDFDTVKLYTVNRDSVKIDEDTFNDTRFYKHTLSLDNNKLMQLVELNIIDAALPGVTTVITKKELLDHLNDTEEEIIGAQVVTKSHVVIK